MEIILHAGPMKTGSTFLQACMKLNRAGLLRFGIAYEFCNGAVEQPHSKGSAFIRTRVLKHLAKGRPALLLSSELMARFDNTGWSLSGGIRDLKKRAILFYRPLTELYVSLYLQTLKGPSMRTGTFANFVRRQMAVDRAPGEGMGQTFNFGFLDRKLKSEGFETAWIRYDRDSLLDDFLAAVDAGRGAEIAKIVKDNLHNLPAPHPLSALRSLKMRYAPIASNINRLVREGRISASDRVQLLSLLLDLSETAAWPDVSAIPAGLAAEIATFDSAINGQFYHRIAASTSTPALQEQET